jgi:GNAT superfamily N-acetyltransferase
MTGADDRAAWLERNRRAMVAAFGSFVRSGGGTVLELDGVFAGINPNAAERSVFNSVVYSDREALERERERLAGAYAEHGCAWTVWVPEDDVETARMLDAAGHRLDAEPRAMGLELDGFPEPDLGDIAWSNSGDHAAMCRLNDLAYGYPAGTWMRGLGESAPEGLRIYTASLAGEPAAAVTSMDTDRDCSIWMVATIPQARGHGLSTALMRRALRDAAERGCATSTLQATKLGRPVYERVGYRDFGVLQMWEHRQHGRGL